MIEILQNFFTASGLLSITLNEMIMIIISLTLIYLAIAKDYEPYLLLPIAFGMLLVNLPMNGLMTQGGLFSYLYKGIEFGIFPPLIFLGVGALTDFGPLIANPKSLLLGAAAQIGIFVAFLGAILLGLSVNEAASIGIIGGADGPTAIYLTSKLAPQLLGPVAIAAYSYMALVPIIQPPIIKALTTKTERKIKMTQLREVSQIEKIIFPISVTIIVGLIVPSAITLIGMLMLGNLLRESKRVSKLVETVSGPLMYTVTVLIGLSVGAKAQADVFLDFTTLLIIGLGLLAFAISTASGILVAKLMNKFTKYPVNPIIGAAGVSAVPMAARVCQKVGQQEDSANFLLMHAMGPNVAGVIGSAVAAGILLNVLS